MFQQKFVSGAIQVIQNVHDVDEVSSVQLT